MSDKELITPVTPDEVDDIRVTLNTDEGDIECRPLTIFEVDGEDYIALMPLDENDQDNAEGIVYFYGYSEDAQGLAELRYIDDEEDADSLTLREVPKHTLVYEISGPLFFGVADKIMNIAFKEDDKCVVVRMRSVNTIDATAMHALEELYDSCSKKKVQLVLSHVNAQPMSMIKKAGFYEKVGEENFCSHIDDALARAKQIAEA